MYGVDLIFYILFFFLGPDFRLVVRRLQEELFHGKEV